MCTVYIYYIVFIEIGENFAINILQININNICMCYHTLESIVCRLRCFAEYRVHLYSFSTRAVQINILFGLFLSPKYIAALVRIVF